MSDESKPLEEIGRANEEAYHRTRDAELIAQLRAKLATEKNASDIQAETGVSDEAMLNRLAGLGITKGTLPIVHLVPLFNVAWADGEIQDAERLLLEEAAAATGINDGDARALFDEMLTTPPNANLVAACTAFISMLLTVLPEDEATQSRDNLVNMSIKIADACGGVFGLWGRIEGAERTSLERIAQRLADAHPQAANDLMKRL